jgi:post-segregation antitoxin (ccd killing protein)
MNEATNQNHSSKSELATRVKVKRKEAKTTVGITISPRILAEARERNLNISRICEQALTSILEYYPHENETESSKFLSSGSFQKETLGRGCPSLVGGRPAKSVVSNGRVGSNPTPRAKSP